MRTVVVALVLVFWSSAAWAKPEETYVCSPPAGATYLHSSSDADSWDMSKDRLGGYDLVLRLKGERLFMVFMPNERMKAVGVKEAVAELQRVSSDENQSTFMGIEAGAPVMVSFFHGMKLMSYSRHRFNVMRGGKPDSAVMFANCGRVDSGGADDRRAERRPRPAD